MRVLAIIDSLAVGGAEQSLAVMAPHLVARGIDLHVGYLTERPGVGEDLASGGATVHSLAGRGGRVGGAIRTVRAIHRIKPDLVHTTLFEADLIGRLAAWLNRVPVVSSFVTESYGPEHVGNPEYRAWKVRAAQIADAATARVVRRFHAVSASSAEVMARRLVIDPTKVDIVPRGRDTATLGLPSRERRTEVRLRLGVDEREPLVVAVGRHYNLKGLDILVKAMPHVVAAVPGVRLFVAGREGPATAELRRLAASGGVAQSVTFGGYRRDVPDLMCAADVFVLPSRAEGSPGVLLEAMALGVPTVASDIPSVREVAGPSGETALLVPIESPQAMAAAVVQLLEDRELAVRLGQAARRRFLATFTVESIAEQTVALYERCLNGRGSSAPLG